MVSCAVAELYIQPIKMAMNVSSFFMCNVVFVSLYKDSKCSGKKKTGCEPIFIARSLPIECGLITNCCGRGSTMQGNIDTQASICFLPPH